MEMSFYDLVNNFLNEKKPFLIFRKCVSTLIWNFSSIEYSRFFQIGTSCDCRGYFAVIKHYFLYAIGTKYFGNLIIKYRENVKNEHISTGVSYILHSTYKGFSNILCQYYFKIGKFSFSFCVCVSL